MREGRGKKGRREGGKINGRIGDGSDEQEIIRWRMVTGLERG